MIVTPTALHLACPHFYILIQGGASISQDAPLPPLSNSIDGNSVIYSISANDGASVERRPQPILLIGTIHLLICKPDF